MAMIRFQQTEELIDGEEAVHEFLASQNIFYEKWNPEKVPGHLNGKFCFSDGEQAELLTEYQQEIGDLAERKGCKHWDIVALSDETPNIYGLLKQYGQVHTHTEDEIRAVIAGAGIVTVRCPIGYFSIELEPGDAIAIPKQIPHYFSVAEKRQVVAVRLYVKKEGLVEHLYEEEHFPLSEV